MPAPVTPRSVTRLLVPAIPVPSDIRDGFRNARSSGSSFSTSWTADHPRGTERQFRKDLAADLPAPPSAQDQRAELSRMRQIAGERTPEATARARTLGVGGTDKIWTELFDSLNHAAPLSDAARGRALLHTAITGADAVSGTVKERFARPRPFNVDPNIDPVVRKPGGATSYPSSHAACSIAAATVLAALWPRHGAEIQTLADEVAWSRVYGGVHYPSDVLMGARVGAAVAAHVLA